jgi:zona occludens toxin (predicted ATPase)
MFTRIQSRAFVMVSLGLVAIGNSLNSQSVTPAAKPSQDNKIQLSYHVKAIKRDSAGQYTMSGTVNGELQGRATLVFGFDEGSSGEAGKALIHSSWVVTAVPASESFKAKVRGTVEVVSGQTHLVGKITEGANKGRRVETTSRVLDFGPYGSLSDIDGNMIIDGK